MGMKSDNFIIEGLLSNWYKKNQINNKNTALAMKKNESNSIIVVRLCFQ